ncbi:MAG: protein-L-isoaspartate(D-aspartate) O-methyltransferase [Dehalococcoidales bacterium]|nr:protein-L-isoaspartate(D-aspartate) O-methyltransferase [Dehalococcoidales bacterium]
MDFAAKRAGLVEHLRIWIKDKRVLEAINRVPRECFVPDRFELMAYNNEALPIGHKQTISQPLIVAMMAEALKLKGSEKVLEIGTGSGYQTAILAELAREVVTTERIPDLAESARKALCSLGYSNIKMYLSADKLGWDPEAPYDCVVVSAGAPDIPDSLLKQMAVGGRLVIPVGSRSLQELRQVTLLEDRTVVHSLGGCRFVPLIGAEAWEEKQ